MIATRPLHAPRQDRAVVAEPSLDQVPDVLALNRRLLEGTEGDFLGRPWSDLRQQARREAIEAAADYLRQAGEPVPRFESQSLLLSGHQPELFHPGVWVKNFALHGMAQAHGATPINLVVDNDTAKDVALKVPALSGPTDALPHRQTVPFDLWAGEVPYEERPVRDEGLFASLPERAAEYVRDWGFRPLLHDFWQEARRQADRTPLLGERLVAARRTVERRWGCHNLELPLSRLCQTQGFAWFASHLLVHLPQFHAVYNASLRDYRRQYRIRSRNHPVPELAAQGDWLEVPLWAWRTGGQQRGRLMARLTATDVELRVGEERWPSLPRGPKGNAARLVEAFQGLEHAGYKVRTRALVNTLYARLVLADLFVHGIGGGKYDELTDEIIRRFYGLEPPQFLVLSATLLLPLAARPATPDDCRHLEHEIRDLRYNPQRHLADGARLDPAARALVARKELLVRSQPEDAPGRRERFRLLRGLTDTLFRYVAADERRLEERLRRCERDLQANAVLQRRDYAFCLYPESLLRPFCTQFLAGRP